MKSVVRIMWLLVIAGGVMLCRWYSYGPWWENASLDTARFGPQAVLWTCAWVVLLIVAVAASRGSGNVAPRGRRFQFGLRTLLFVLTAAAVVMGVATWCFPESKSPAITYHSLTDIRARYSDYDLVQGPDQAGPYEDLGAACAGEGGTLAGSFWANGKRCKFYIPGSPGVEFRAVGLLSRDGGEITYIVLKRRDHK